jgi:NAD+-dependent protein deacetylase sirtuin 6
LHKGPEGIWTLRSKGKRPKYNNHIMTPTLTHMCIKKLIDEGFVKYLVSQNTDNLHIMSGVAHSQISELHGNVNKEYCPNCKKIFYRNFDTRNSNRVNDHRTERNCTDCNSELKDSIVDFDEPLPEEELKEAIKNSKMCDLSIVLGTSLRVTPACDLPTMNKNSKLVLCNLQKTPFDDVAEMVSLF